MDTLTIYINPERSTVINVSDLHIKDVMSVYCVDPEVTATVEKIKLYSFHPQMDGRQIISVLKVIEEINKVYKDAKVVNIGDPEFIVFHKKPMPVTKKSKLIENFKILFVCIVTFFGAAFTIMTYNNDVGVNELFEYIYELFMGHAPTGNGAIQLGYSFGLTIGLFFFFNHVSHHRLTDEPTPLEVEMRLYERDVNDAMAINSERNKKTLDVK